MEIGAMNLNSTDKKAVRKFGLTALVFFGLLFTWCVWMKKPVLPYVFGFLTLLGAALFAFPSRMKSLYNVWLKTAHLIGWVITTIILSLGFYLVITPAAIIKRIVNGRPLPVKPDKGVSTYWITRTEPAQPRERFMRRY